MTQLNMWQDFYDEKEEEMKVGFFVPPKVLNLDHYKFHVQVNFRFIDAALKKMGIFELMTVNEPIYPDVIRQVHCTVFFHNDPARTITWMAGIHKVSATFAEFCDALGYGVGRASGFCIHSENVKSNDFLLHCYPPAPTAKCPKISGMYYYYHSLAKLFHANLVSKASDDANC